MSNNVIALLRVSSDAQAGPDRQGLPSQREACEALATAHRLRIVEWVSLPGVSGAAVLAEPKFQHLLSRLSDASIDGVVAAAFDRVFRPSRFADFAILDSFRDANAKIYTGSGVLDPATQNDALLGLITGHLAGAEREAIARRTRAGRERRRREKGVRAEGDGRTAMPRGVIFDRKNNEWRYEYPAAAQVRKAFDLFLSGETNLSEIGRQTGIGDRKAYAVRSLLTQPLYMGIYRVDRKWIGSGKWIPRAPEDCYEHEVIKHPLVTPAEFERAQSRLLEIAGSRPRLPALEDRPVEYAGFAFCARCGAKLMVLEDKRSKIWNYRCARDHRGRERQCDMGQFSASKLDPKATEALTAALSDAETIIRLVHEGMERSAAAAPSGAELARQMTMLDNRRRRLVDGYEMGTIEPADFRKRVATIDTERNALSLLMEAAEPPEIDEDACIDLAYAFARWGRLGRVRRRKLLEAYGVRFWVDKQGRGRNSVVLIPRIEIGALNCAAIYKKIKRLGVE